MIGLRALFFLALAATSAEAQQNQKATVAITSPADGAVLPAAVIDIDVAWSSGADKKGDKDRMESVELRLNGTVVAVHVVPAGPRDGTHRFSGVTLPAGAPVTILARGKIGIQGGKHSDSAPVRVTIQAGDTVAPVISGVVPAPGGVTNLPRQPLSAVLSDAGGTGVDRLSVVLRLDGAVTGATVALDGTSVSFTPTADLAEGPHTFTVDAKDLAGNAAAQASSTFLADRTPPVSSISAPPLVGNQAQPPLVALVVDSGAGVATGAVSVLLDGVPVAASVAVVNASTLSVAFTPTTPLGQGYHSYQVSAVDRAGNIGPSAVRTFLIDLTAPTAVIDVPVEGFVSSDSRQPFSATLADLGGSGIDTTGVVVTLDTAILSPTVTPTSATFVPPAPLAPGLHTYSIKVRDLAGNGSAQILSSFTVVASTVTIADATIPNGGFVSTTTPAYTATLTNVQGTGITPGSIVVRLDGAEVTALVQAVDANTVTVSFTPLSPLAAGPHTITIDGTTGAGASFGTVTSGFGVDLISPVIGVFNPHEGQVVDVPAPVITVGVSDDGGSGLDLSLTFVLVNGVLVSAEPIPAGPDAVTLRYALPALPDGPVAVLVEVHDGAGNSSTQGITFHVDTASPLVDILSPAGPVPTTAVTVQVRVRDFGSGINLNSIQVVLNGQEVPGLAKNVISTTPAGIPTEVLVIGAATGQDGGNTMVATAADLGGRATSKAGSFTVESTPPPGVEVIPFPAFTVDVEKVSARPLIEEDVQPQPGVDAQAWTNRPIMVKVRLANLGEPIEGVPIKVTLGGYGSIFHTPQYPRLSGSDGIAGFGFLCPRRPGYTVLTIAADLPQPGVTVQYQFKANLVDPHVILVGDFPGSGIYASVSAPSGIGRTAVVVDEVDSSNLPVTDPALQKMTNFSTTYHTNRNGILHIPLILKDGATGIARLRVSYPEFADDNGDVLSFVDTFNIDNFLSSGAIRTVMINSGNGQVLYPGRALDQLIVVTPLVAPTSQNPLKLVSVSIVQNETHVGPDWPGSLEPVDGQLLSDGTTPTTKSFTAVVTNPNGTLSFRYTADPSGIGATLVIGGGIGRAGGGAAALAPGDRVVIREPEIRLVTVATQEHLSWNPPYSVDDLVAGTPSSSEAVRYEVRIPQSGVGGTSLPLSLQALRSDYTAVSDDGSWPPAQKTLTLTMTDPDVYVSEPVFIANDRRVLDAVPTGGPEAVFGGAALRALLNLAAPAQAQQQQQGPLLQVTDPTVPDKEGFAVDLVNGRVNVVDATPKTRLKITLRATIPPNGPVPFSILGRTDPAVSGPLGQFIVNGTPSGPNFNVEATTLTSLEYEFDAALLPAGVNSAEGLLQFRMVQFGFKGQRHDADLKVRFSKANPVLVGYYYLQTNAQDLPFGGRLGQQLVARFIKHHAFAKRIWEQNGIQLKAGFEFPGGNVASGLVPNAPANPFPADTLNWVAYSPVPPGAAPPPSTDVFLKGLMTRLQTAAPVGQKPQVFVFFIDGISYTVNGVLELDTPGFVLNIPPVGGIVKPNFAVVKKSHMRDHGVPLEPNQAVIAHELGHVFGLLDLPNGMDPQNLMQRGNNRATRLAVIAGFQDQFSVSAGAANLLK